MPILIKGGHVTDPGNWDGPADILITEGEIIAVIAPNLSDKDAVSTGDVPENTKIVDATGKIVVPGLVDMHVHLREPGHEYKETILTGCMAAAAGGFSDICCMPNTKPVNDNSEVTTCILKKARKAAGARVYPVAGISKGLAGKILCEYGDLKDAGAIALSDDGFPVMDSGLMQSALESAKEFDLPIISHCEDRLLAADGVMNEGIVARRLGFSGIPNAAEAAMVTRDILLCELTGARLHIAHVSTKESVKAVRDAKSKGVPVSAETAPHYFTLTHEAVENYNTNAKMNPPLRSPRDVEAVREGLSDGTIDVIASDHAPHSITEKEVQFEKAANGIIGLETSLALSLNLVEQKIVTLPELIEKMSINPARILGLEKGISVGKKADITIIDTKTTYTVDAAAFKSQSRNTPFDGWKLKGRAVWTMSGGKIIFDEIL
ncbi:MAG: dihydroorotase [Deltaproteobacteria bacterium]|nr:dihydroorotase [Deltaproteobacteria bacterium]